MYFFEVNLITSEEQTISLIKNLLGRVRAKAKVRVKVRVRVY